jgi:hypothetical protein
VPRKPFATSLQNTEQPQRISSFCLTMILPTAGG